MNPLFACSISGGSGGDLNFASFSVGFHGASASAVSASRSFCQQLAGTSEKDTSNQEQYYDR